MTNKRVFIADDDSSMLNTLKTQFEKKGFVVETATSYITARELLDNRDYDLIVCDNGMPLGGERRPDPTCGLQLLAHSKMGRHEETPFIIHTAGDDETMLENIKLCGGIFQAKVYDAEIDVFLAHLK